MIFEFKFVFLKKKKKETLKEGAPERPPRQFGRLRDTKWGKREVLVEWEANLSIVVAPQCRAFCECVPLRRDLHPPQVHGRRSRTDKLKTISQSVSVLTISS